MESLNYSNYYQLSLITMYRYAPKHRGDLLKYIIGDNIHNNTQSKKNEKQDQPDNDIYINIAKISLDLISEDYEKKSKALGDYLKDKVYLSLANHQYNGVESNLVLKKDLLKEIEVLKEKVENYNFLAFGVNTNSKQEFDQLLNHILPNELNDLKGINLRELKYDDLSNLLESENPQEYKILGEKLFNFSENKATEIFTDVLAEKILDRFSLDKSEGKELGEKEFINIQKKDEVKTIAGLVTSIFSTTVGNSFKLMKGIT